MRDSKTPTTFTTSGILSDITLSSTLNPNAVVFCVSPFVVDIPEFVRLTLILLLLSNVFCFTFISFLRTVVFTTTLVAPAPTKLDPVNPWIVNVWPLFDIVTWSDVKGAISPAFPWTEYLSSSKVSNIAFDATSVSVIFAVNTPVAPMATPVICVLTDKSEFVNDTSETFLFSSFANNPFPSSWITGIALRTPDISSWSFKVVTLTPLTAVVAANVSDFKSALIAVIRCNLASVSPLKL